MSNTVPVAPAAPVAAEPAQSAAAPAKTVLSFRTRRVVAESEVKAWVAGRRADVGFAKEHRLQTVALLLAEGAARAHEDAEKFRAQQAEHVRRSALARELEARNNQADAERRAVHEAEVARLGDEYGARRAAKVGELNVAREDVDRLETALRAAKALVKTRESEHGNLVVEQQLAIATARAAQAAERKAAGNAHHAAVTKVIREGVVA